MSREDESCTCRNLLTTLVPVCMPGSSLLFYCTEIRRVIESNFVTGSRVHSTAANVVKEGRLQANSIPRLQSH